MGHLHQAEDSCRYVRCTDITYRECHPPLPINDAEMRYADVAGSKLRELAKVMGGVIRPAPMLYLILVSLDLLTSKHGESMLQAGSNCKY
jgi:hypothetical protein